MDKGKPRNKAEIIEITAEVLDEKVENIRKAKGPKPSLEGQIRQRLSFAWLGVISALWFVFSLIEIFFKALGVLLGLFVNKQANGKLLRSVRNLVLPIGYVASCAIAVIVPSLGIAVLRKIDKFGMRAGGAAYGIIRLMFVKYL